MMAFIILLFFLAYLAVSIGVVLFAMNTAKKKGVHRWKYGMPAGLFMYLIIFWQIVPTLAVHKTYCVLEAGFVVYTSIDEWVAANPGEAKKQIYGEKREVIRVDNRSGYTMRNHISQRFDWVHKKDDIFLSVKRITYALVDRQTENTLMKQVNFMSGGGKGFGFFTFQTALLRNSGCGPESRLESRRYVNYQNKFKALGTVLK